MPGITGINRRYFEAGTLRCLYVFIRCRMQVSSEAEQLLKQQDEVKKAEFIQKAKAPNKAELRQETPAIPPFKR